MVAFGEGDKIAPFNPLRRVPTLVLDDGEALIESTAILDYLDELAGVQDAMIAENGLERRRDLRICALATGLGDIQAVSLLYERVLRKEFEDLGRALRGADIRRARGAGKGARRDRTAVLVRRAHRPADIAVACVLRFTGEASAALRRALSRAVSARYALRRCRRSGRSCSR